MTIAVPTKLKTRNLFFTSLEKAFEMKNATEVFKVEILFNLVGEWAVHLLVYVNMKEMKDYEKVKVLILKKFQPTPHTCLKTFLLARRAKNENRMQFMSRLRMK